MTFLCGTAFACQREPPLHIKYKIDLTHQCRSDTTNEKNTRLPRNLLKIGRTPLGPLTLFTFRDIFEFAALKKRFHLDFPATGTKEFLGSVGCEGIFTCLTHGLLLAKRHFRGVLANPKITILSVLWAGENCQERQYNIRQFWISAKRQCPGGEASRKRLVNGSHAIPE
jgi:hypothetical protein